MTGERICAVCNKRYYRSNLVRAWVATNFGHRAGWIREIQKICCHCMKAADAQAMLKEINPKWRQLKAIERIVTTPPKKAT